MPQSANLGAIANVAGATFRLDSNLAFQALASSSSGASAPDPTYPFQLWWDTSVSPHLLKQRTPANNGWVIVGEWTGSQYRPRRDGVALGTAAIEAAGTGANQLVKLDCQSALKIDPRSASKIDPLVASVVRPEAMRGSLWLKRSASPEGAFRRGDDQKRG